MQYLSSLVKLGISVLCSFVQLKYDERCCMESFESLLRSVQFIITLCQTIVWYIPLVFS